MPRKPLSVTLERDNIAWLKGRAGATGESVSELLDQIVTGARQNRQLGPARSVVGTIDVDTADPGLDRADARVRAAFEQSMSRPFLVGERGKTQRGAKRSSRSRNTRDA
jgi:hypothetical protein